MDPKLYSNIVNESMKEKLFYPFSEVENKITKINLFTFCEMP